MVQFLRWHRIHKLWHDCTDSSLGNIINKFLKGLLTTLLIFFPPFVLISLSLQSGVTSFYSSTSSYNSVASHPCEAGASTEIELAEWTPKNESSKRDPLAWWIVIVVLCLIWVCKILSSSKTAKGKQIRSCKTLSNSTEILLIPQNIAYNWSTTLEQPLWSQLLRVLMAFGHISVMVLMFPQWNLCFCLFSPEVFGGQELCFSYL